MGASATKLIQIIPFDDWCLIFMFDDEFITASHKYYLGVKAWQNHTFDPNF